MFTDEARREFIKHFEGLPDQVIAMAWVYADFLTKYGVDVSAEWPNVSARRDALNRAYVQGRADEAERWSRQEYEAAAEQVQYCELHEPTYDPDMGAL